MVVRDREVVLLGWVEDREVRVGVVPVDREVDASVAVPARELP